MPVQHTLCGQPLSLRLPPRRIIFAFGTLAVFAIITFIFSFSTSRSIGALGGTDFSHTFGKETEKHLPNDTPKPKPRLSSISIPQFRNPFALSAHKPPVQANSRSGAVSWHSHYKWLNPFSSSVTLDEARIVLPPMKQRPVVYTFFDTSDKKAKETREAEEKLLLIWRRAWWAQGFRPVVLGRAESVNNPLHETVQSMKLESTLEADLARWLAWEQMGSGILANWLALPMGSSDDPLLAYLRRGSYPDLTRYQGLGSGLFCGERDHITAILKEVLANPKLNETKSVIDALPEKAFTIDKIHQGIAFYDFATLKDKYSAVSEKISKSGAGGLSQLAQLINSHLHTTFQNIYSKGIAVLKPLPDHTTALVEPALQIAHRLAECSESPLSSSCPPNRPDCSPCDSAHPLHLSTPQIFRNQSNLFTIATVPHPYTLVFLTSQGATLNRKYIRRQTERDLWILAATRELMGPDIGAEPRIIRYKAAVASDANSVSSLWLTAEKPKINDLSWHFGFTLPKAQPATTVESDPSKLNTGSTPPIPEKKKLVISSHPDPEGPIPSPEALKVEQSLLQKASVAVLSKARQQVSVRDMVEAWNLADTEAWRFARAYRARAQKERSEWEKEEKGFAGGSGAGRGMGWARWFDRLA